MSEAHEDQALRDEFAAQRNELRGSGRIPDFDAMMAKARAETADGIEATDELAARRARIPRAGAWMTLATAAAAATLVFVVDRGPGSDADAEFERLVAGYSATTASGAFASPTSGLLEIPGVDLGTVPSVGSTLRGFDRARPRPVERNEGRDS